MFHYNNNKNDKKNAVLSVKQANAVIVAQKPFRSQAQFGTGPNVRYQQKSSFFFSLSFLKIKVPPHITLLFFSLVDKIDHAHFRCS